MDADTNDIASNGFGNTLTRDGQGQPTANLPMAGFRHTGVQNGVARSDYAAMGQAQDGLLAWTAAGGSSDAITVTYTPALTALADGQLCFFRATAANTTTTPTFAPNSLTAHTITKLGGAALLAGDIAGNLTEVILRYNLSNTRWELLNPQNLPFNPQVQGTNWIAAAGTHDAITATYSPAVTALYDGLLCFFRATAANTTTTPTFAPNSLTAHTITKNGGAALLAGDIPGNLAEVILRYNLANTRWELLNPNGGPTYKVPTIQAFSSGSSATYTAPTNPAPLYIVVEMVAGGGGGGAGTTGTGGSGNNSSFASWTAVGGGAGAASGGAAGSGGTGGSTGTGTQIIRVAGGSGGGGQFAGSTGVPNGGMGGGGAYGGAGAGGAEGSGGSTAAANSGSGGGGGGGGATANSGSGGGAGEYVKFLVSPAPATATYTVGASASGGSGSGNGGGGGAAGRITVYEYYQ